LPGPSEEVIRQYLQEAIGAEEAFESRLRQFASDGDDDEVQLAFRLHADETRSQRDRLAVRLRQLGGDAGSAGSSSSAHFFDLPPGSGNGARVPEERIARNLIAAYAVEAGECAMYEALALAAARNADAPTEQLAREIQAEERKTAEILWHFLPSRSKIAFNMLTLEEIDPSVETRTSDDRIEP
jgi:ferritin-like metal-binding protein YciE